MTKIYQTKISDKLELLNQYLKYLKQLKKEIGSEKQFLSDFHLFGSAERYMQLSIQALIDISHMVIINLGIERPDDNYEAISKLVEEKIISGKLAQNITKMIGLRNILVHEYGVIDRKKIYAVLKNNLDDLKEFKQKIASLLNKK
ncbi:MAG: DUF86 domain-containing protein [Candidatus Pacebacteria bacterium]|nr:DUF86 domain-containing protein [Candidatus Paceibacterota bacterium]